MPNTPKRIWAKPTEFILKNAKVTKQIWAKSTEFSLKNAKATGGVWHTRPTITQSHTRYTRDDIVDELVEAHEENLRILGYLSNELQGLIPSGKLWAIDGCKNRSRDAIAKYKETET